MIADSFENAACSIKVSFPRHDIVLFEISGYLDVEGANYAIQQTDKLVERNSRVWVFNDWTELRGYDSQSRQMLTVRTKELGDKIVGSHILVKSSIVAMGVSVANFLLNQSQIAHSKKESFENALQGVLSVAE